jgi:hypothetical protein
MQEVYYSFANTVGEFIKVFPPSSPCTLATGRKAGQGVTPSSVKLVEPTNQVVGVDLGIATQAVDSNGNKYGCDHWKQVEDRTFELRRGLQFYWHEIRQEALEKALWQTETFQKGLRPCAV